MVEGNSAIDSLPIQNRGQKPLVQKIYYGQSAAHGHFDPSDRVQMQTLDKMMKSSEVQKHMLDAVLSPEDIIDWASHQGKGPVKELLYSVFSSPEAWEKKYQQKMPKNNKKEGEGFVNFYWNGEVRQGIKKAMKLRILPADVPVTNFVEVSYGKGDGAPHQVSSAMRGVLIDANKYFVTRRLMTLGNSLVKEYQAQGDTPNEARKRALETIRSLIPHEPYEVFPSEEKRQDFISLVDRDKTLTPAQKLLKKSPVSTVFIAYISPNNPNSIHAAESSGFVKVGKLPDEKNDDGGIVSGDYVLLLDWDRLNEKMQQQALNEKLPGKNISRVVAHKPEGFDKRLQERLKTNPK